MKEQIGPYKKILKLKPIAKDGKQEPELKLQGSWLRKNGFETGKEVEIIYGYEYIVIYPYKNEAL